MASERTAMLQGSATYLADLRVPEIDGVAHAVFVRSTVAHAHFRVDVSAAREMPGVLVVLDGEHNHVHPTIAYSPLHPPRFAQPLLAEHKVRYVGEPIAVVVAETLAMAIDAAELVVVDYEPLEPVLDLAQATTDRVLLFDDGSLARRNRHSAADHGSAPTNIVRTELDDNIDAAVVVGGVIEASDVTVSVQVQNPRQAAAPIECRGIVAAWSADNLRVWMSTQTPHAFRNRVAPMYDMAVEQIHVIAGPFVGGGFGGKGAPGPEEQIVPELARLAGRPVQWIESRGENLTSAPQGRAEELQVTLAGTAEGHFEAIRVQHRKDAGAYPSSGAGLPASWTWPMVHGPYDIAHVEYEQQTVVTNRPPVSALRGAGRGPVIAAIERAVDRFAAVSGIDPVELRRRNLIRPTAMPYLSSTGFTFDEADYPAALDAAVRRADVAALRGEQASRRTRGDTTELGIGVACYNHRTCGPGGEAAAVRINDDGSATVVTGTTSQGQDHEGTWRSIASAELGIEPDRITVIEGDTAEIATGIGAVGSRSVQTAGMAIVEASAEVIDQARTAAATMLEAAPADLVFDKGAGSFHVVGTPARSLGWADVAMHLSQTDERLQCEHIYDNDGNDVYPSGCHVAVVEVDTETGRWSVRSFVGVDDAGVRINESAVTGQLHGGIALGIAQALGEACTYDADGNPTAGSFLDYAAVTADQLPPFDLEAQVVPTSVNPGGWKAVGESGPIGALPAIHNAVLDALAPFGIDHLDIPLTPQRVWQALQG